MSSFKTFAILLLSPVLAIFFVATQAQLASSQQSLQPTGPLATVDLQSNTSAPNPMPKKTAGKKVLKKSNSAVASKPARTVDPAPDAKTIGKSLLAEPPAKSAQPAASLDNALRTKDDPLGVGLNWSAGNDPYHGPYSTSSFMDKVGPSPLSTPDKVEVEMKLKF
ncbi:MAG: hypothetical protein ACLQIQ_19840 [Beijerinckiaceae bacterium]